MALSPGLRYRKNDSFVSRRIAGETILVPIRRGVGNLDSIYTLNEAASFIWERIDGTMTVKDLQAALLEEFDVGPEAAASDLEAFLSDMTAIQAILPVVQE